MRAVVFEEHGGPEKLQLTERPDPRPGPGEVLVRIRASALNHLDIWVRQGLPGVAVEMPHISGSDIAGEVMEAGPGATRFKKGDRVIISPGQGCGRCEECLAGRESLCESFDIVGLRRNGGYAEQVAVAEWHLFPISEKLAPEEWAAIPLVFTTSWHMLVTRAALKPTETILIHAAGSGIGSAAIQIAKWIGARVIATAGSPDKIRKGKRLGADEGINYRDHPRFSTEVKKITGGRGVDVVFEHIGPETFSESVASLSKNGRLVFCGATTGPEVRLDLRPAYLKQLSFFGSYMGSKAELARVLDLVEEGVFRPVLGTTYPLEKAREAQERMLSRDFFGKIVLAC